MSKWTHAICAACYDFEFPDRAGKAKEGNYMPGETCCFCGEQTTSGIFIRHDPQDPRLFCKGGENHAD